MRVDGGVLELQGGHHIITLGSMYIPLGPVHIPESYMEPCGVRTCWPGALPDQVKSEQ